VTLFHFLIGVLGVVIPLSDWLWNGPSAYVPGIDGRKIFDPLTPTGFRGPTNSYAELSVPVATDVIRSVCLAVALVAAAALLSNRFFRELRLPALVAKGFYALAVVTAVASWFALRTRPEPETYAASLPERATLSTSVRPSSAPSSETVVPGLTLNYECMYGACGISAGQGCSIYPNEPAFDRVTLRRDEQRGWWVFDAGHAQLVFRDGDHECVTPQYVHVMSSVRPSRGTYQLAFALLVAATLMLVAGRRASAGKESRGVRSREFGVMLLSAWALYPMLPALLTVWF
jgi:hypothetical protein